MPPPTVLIIGCGIAGPVLALLLKKKGYHPIVFEKVRKLGDAGASLMLMPNGLKVLHMVGIAEPLLKTLKPLTSFHDATSMDQDLGVSDLPSTFRGEYGLPAAGVRRTNLNLSLRDMLVEHGIEVREGWQLLRIEEEVNSVAAHFNDNRSATGSFIVGCDGIKSNTRAAVLALHNVNESAPDYTGLTQTAGIARMSSSSSGGAAELRNWYGDGMHFIAYPISSTHISWAMTRRETIQTSESWRRVNEDELPQMKAQIIDLLHGWNDTVQQLVENAEFLIKFGLFDRPELDARYWHLQRTVLIGDAAHPTSPHLGQGANQALEDCYHLSQALPIVKDDITEGGVDLSTVVLQSIFTDFAQKRHARTSTLVKGARIQGELRVAQGAEACQQRNEQIRHAFAQTDAFSARLKGLLQEPYRLSPE